MAGEADDFDELRVHEHFAEAGQGEGQGSGELAEHTLEIAQCHVTQLSAEVWLRTNAMLAAQVAAIGNLYFNFRWPASHPLRPTHHLTLVEPAVVGDVWPH